MPRLWKTGKCGHSDPTVSFSPVTRQYLCAACHQDVVRASTVRRVPVPQQEQNDRYAQMARKYGIE